MLGFQLDNPVDRSVRDVELGSDVSCGHSIRRHLKDFVSVQNQMFPPQVISATLALQLGVGGAGTFRAANRFLFRQDRQQRDDHFTKQPGAVDILLRKTFPLDAVAGELSKMLKSVGRTFT